MRTLLLTITLGVFCINTSQAQLQIDELTETLTEVFENSASIKELVSNRKTVLGQLKDLQLWHQNGMLEQNVANDLELAYTAYANIMNAIADEVATELKTISSYKDLKSKRIEKLLKRIEKDHKEQLLNAYEIYISQFNPAFSKAAENAQSKAGILGSIVLILEFGGTIVSALKSIFTNDTFSSESKDSLISLGMKLVADKIVSQLQYPEWNQNKFPQLATNNNFNLNTQSNYAMTSRTTFSDSENYENVNQRITQRTISPATEMASVLSNEIRLSTFKQNRTIALENISKGITVGSETVNGDEMQLYTTTEALRSGDRFWVTLSGQLHAQFYYYDEHTQSWMDPFGKGIIVGKSNSIAPEMVHLPSQDSYFEITGDNATEQFFILISTDEISDIIKTGITGGTVTGVSFLTALDRMIPLKYPTIDTNTGALQLPLITQNEDPIFYGVYITIDKTIHP